MTAAEDHYLETLRNAATWDRKAVLRAVYQDAYERIREALACEVEGPTVEIGSGIGKIKTRIPECITTDLVHSAGIDRVESAYSLGFASESVANLILVDVFHHLRYPGSALDEFRRVLRSKGRLILFEPAMSVLGRFVFGVLHKEPLGWGDPVEWCAPPDIDLGAESYYAAQANCYRVFVMREQGMPLVGWDTTQIDILSSVAYLASGGFTRPQLYPTAWLGLLRTLDRCLDRFPGIFGTRMLVVLQKQ